MVGTRYARGYTLLELLIVLLLIGILTAMGLYRYQVVVNSSHELTSKSALRASYINAETVRLVSNDRYGTSPNDLVDKLNNKGDGNSFYLWAENDYPLVETTQLATPKDILVHYELNGQQVTMCSNSTTGKIFCLRTNSVSPLFTQANLLEKHSQLQLANNSILAASGEYISSSWGTNLGAAACRLGMPTPADNCVGISGSGGNNWLGNGPSSDVPPACPQGQTGTPPSCIDEDPNVCSEGQTGTPPNCIDEDPDVCSEGQTGTPPNCIDENPDVCGEGYTGTPPNCGPANPVTNIQNPNRVIDTDWVNGYCANVYVTNPMNYPITWEVTLPLTTYPFNGEIASSSNITTVSLTNNVSWTVRGIGWNNVLAAGATTTLHYCANRPLPELGVTIKSIVITTEWQSGYCAEVTLTTSSEDPITWEAVLTKSISPYTNAKYWPAQESSAQVSNAQTVSLSSTQWKLKGIGWNDRIWAGQDRMFSYCSSITS